MSDNDSPYQMPESAITAPADAPQSQPIKAILIGLVIVWLGRNLPSLAFPIWLSYGRDVSTQSQFLTIYTIVLVACRILFGFLSGYACAHLVKRREFRHALLLAALAAVYAALGWFSIAGAPRVHGDAASYVPLMATTFLSITFILLGTWLGWWRNRRLAKKMSDPASGIAG